MTDVAREEVEALVRTASEAVHYAAGFDVAGWEPHMATWEVIAKADIALARLHSLLLRAEEERDHWKSEATGLASEQRVADSIEAENERLREIERAARRVMNDLQPHPEERLVLDGEVELRAALARIPESKP